MVSHNLQSVGYFKGKPKNSHCADALVVYCMDFRFQDPFEKFINKQNFVHGCDHVVLAGGVKDKEEVDKHIQLGITLHNIKKVLLVNHRTCGAYGRQLAKNPKKELDRHVEDLVATATRLHKKYPTLQIRTLFADIAEPDKDASTVEIFEINWQKEARAQVSAPPKPDQLAATPTITP